MIIYISITYLLQIKKKLLYQRPLLEIPEPLRLTVDPNGRLDLKPHRLLNAPYDQIHSDRHVLPYILGRFHVQRFESGLCRIPRRRNDGTIAIQARIRIIIRPCLILQTSLKMISTN